jgi:murein tripeptide amidase MpaA
MGDRLSTPLLFDHYYDYAELDAAINALTAAYPHLVTRHQIGTSHQGRAIFLVELTNRVTGPGDAKPGYYIDGCIHAEELAASMAPLHTVYALCTQYGINADITELLDTQVIYIVPRLNPDGAELVLKTPYYWCGNGRDAPAAVFTDGLVPTDLNGDGLITQMRVPDPLGEWKVSEKEPRLMVLRGADERGGRYYRVLPEGVIPGFDGAAVRIPKPPDGNLNRNYPSNFLPDPFQYGAGPYPLSEPETCAVVEWIVAHPNIHGALAYHTHSGVLLRPYLNKPDSAFPKGDLGLYIAIGALGTEETGYPMISVYEDFTDDKSTPRTGSFSEWAYEEKGILTFATELWDPYTAAGLKKPEFYPLRAWGEDDYIALLRWADAHTATIQKRPAYVDWAEAPHPQFGMVEVGGWNNIWFFRNPPGDLLAAECARNTRFTVRAALCGPRLQFSLVMVEPLGASLYRVTAIVENSGYLPTNVTQQAIAMRTALPVTVTLAVEGGTIELNDATQSLGHLAGRSERRTTYSPWSDEWGTPRKRARWLVRGEAGAALTLTAKTPRAGTIVQTLTLDESDD